MKRDGVSIVIPARNEAEVIQSTLAELHRHLPAAELIVVDDNSTDNTAAVVEKMKKKIKNLRRIGKKGEPGKATTLLLGFKEAKGSVLGMIDADLQYPPDALPRMISIIENDEADIVVAKRDFRKHDLRWLLSSVFTALFGNILLGVPSSDIQSGEKVFKKEVIRSLDIRAKKWEFDIEFLYRAHKKGFRIAELPVNFERRGGGSTKINVLFTAFNLGSTASRLFLERLTGHRTGGQHSRS